MKKFSKFFSNIKKKIGIDALIIISLAIVTLILGIMLLVVNFCGGDPQISVGSATVKVGETVDIPIKFNNNPGTWGANIIIEYDDENLSIVSYESNDVYAICNANAADGELVILAEPQKDEESSKDGAILTVKFKAKISSEAGEYQLKFSDDCEVINSGLEFVDINYKNGKIVIKE